VDRNGMVLAQDAPSDELAIDYRAMNFDDAWITQRARQRLRASGEWDTLRKNNQLSARMAETKEAIAAQIDGMPRAIAKVLAPVDGISVEEEVEVIRQREDRIRARIHAV